MSYDDAYKKSADFFGSEPTDILRNQFNHINKTLPVLDIGAGQGRNAIFLARQGYTVNAIDPSVEGLKQIDRVAAKDNLKITTKATGFGDFVPEKLPYSGILVFGIIQILSRDSIKTLITKINDWAHTDSCLFISAFSTADPSFRKTIDNNEPAGKNSCLYPNGEYRTFLEPNEILALFPNFVPIDHWEGLGPIHNHGDGTEHRHGSIHFVGKRI